MIRLGTFRAPSENGTLCSAHFLSTENRDALQIDQQRQIIFCHFHIWYWHGGTFTASNEIFWGEAPGNSGSNRKMIRRKFIPSTARMGILRENFLVVREQRCQIRSPTSAHIAAIFSDTGYL
jgi:hypothetical protein